MACPPSFFCSGTGGGIGGNGGKGENGGDGGICEIGGIGGNDGFCGKVQCLEENRVTETDEQLTEVWADMVATEVTEVTAVMVETSYTTARGKF